MLVWDSTFPLLSLKGKGARKFLQGQLSSEIFSIEENKIIRTCWLSPVGKLRALLEIRIENNGASILILSGKTQDLIEGLDRVIFPFDEVSIKLDGEMRRLQKMSFNESWQKSEYKWFDDIDSDLGEFGSLNQSNQIQFEEWRINQGFPSPDELSFDINCFEVGLSNLINLDKGCFLGQETMAKLKNVGYVKQELRLIESYGLNLKPGEKLFFRNKLNKENEELNYAGLITSFLMIDSERGLGLALIRRKYLSSEELFSTGNDAKVGIRIPISFDRI